MDEKQALALLNKGHSLASILEKETVEVHVDVGRGMIVKAIPSYDAESGKVTISGAVENEGRKPVSVTIECDADTAEEYIRDAVEMNLPQKVGAFISARGGRKVYFARRILASKSEPKTLGVGSMTPIKKEGG